MFLHVWRCLEKELNELKLFRNLQSHHSWSHLRNSSFLLDHHSYINILQTMYAQKGQTGPFLLIFRTWSLIRNLAMKLKSMKNWDQKWRFVTLCLKGLTLASVKLTKKHPFLGVRCSLQKRIGFQEGSIFQAKSMGRYFKRLKNARYTLC